jgi:hypothetical protein
MMRTRGKELWVVVMVQSGIPVSVDAYRHKERALRRRTQLRTSVREDYDATGVFRIAIPEGL